MKRFLRSALYVILFSLAVGVLATARAGAADESDKTLRLLTRAREKTEDGQTELIETNGIRVLFYPPDFEYPRHHLGLRYNENWVAEAMKFGHPKKHLRLCCLIPGASAMEHEWRDADDVPPLKFELPDIKSKPASKTAVPVVVRGPVKAIVIGSYSLEDLFNNKIDHATMTIVDAKGVAVLGRDEDGKWTEFRE